MDHVQRGRHFCGLTWHGQRDEPRGLLPVGGGGREKLRAAPGATRSRSPVLGAAPFLVIKNRTRRPVSGWSLSQLRVCPKDRTPPPRGAQPHRFARHGVGFERWDFWCEDLGSPGPGGTGRSPEGAGPGAGTRRGRQRPPRVRVRRGGGFAPTRAAEPRFPLVGTARVTAGPRPSVSLPGQQKPLCRSGASVAQRQGQEPRFRVPSVWLP